MSKSVLIVSYVPPYNRQGYDLAVCLRRQGYDVRLFQMDGKSDEKNGIFGVRCIKPHGTFHKFQMARNFAVFLLRTMFLRKQIVVCVGRPMLILGGLYHLIFGSKLIWYSLEYSKLGRIDRFVYRHCVKGYIDVEENRRDAVFAHYGAKDISLVCHNMPHLMPVPPKGGMLREYLNAKYGVSAKTKIAIYAGSFQTYAQLYNIVAASRKFPETCRLVLMAFGLPENLTAGSANCIVVPPVRGEEFYEWVSDADCALLPYENDSDFNVLNCSPQKLFDCYAVGIPFVASDRPIIRKVLHEYSDAGAVCNFRDISDIVAKTVEVLQRKAHVGEKMRFLHKERFNYDSLSPLIESMMEKVYAK